MRRLVATVLTWLVQRGCAVIGHDLMIEHEPHTLRVVCLVCGWQSKGVELKRKAA